MVISYGNIKKEVYPCEDKNRKLIMQIKINSKICTIFQKLNNFDSNLKKFFW